MNLTVLNARKKVIYLTLTVSPFVVSSVVGSGGTPQLVAVSIGTAVVLLSIISERKHTTCSFRVSTMSRGTSQN